MRTWLGRYKKTECEGDFSTHFLEDSPKVGIILPATAARVRPIFKGIAAATAFAFTMTTLLPAGWAHSQDPATRKRQTLRVGQPESEKSIVRAGLEEAFGKKAEKVTSEPVAPPIPEPTLPAARTIWDTRKKVAPPQPTPAPPVVLPQPPVAASAVPPVAPREQPTVTRPPVTQTVAKPPMPVAKVPLPTPERSEKVRLRIPAAGLEETPRPWISPVIREEYRPRTFTRRELFEWTAFAGAVAAAIGTPLGLREMFQRKTSEMAPFATEPWRIMVGSTENILEVKVGDPRPTFKGSDLPLRDLGLIPLENERTSSGVATILQAVSGPDKVEGHLIGRWASHRGLVPTTYWAADTKATTLGEAEHWLKFGLQLLAAASPDAVQPAQWEAAQHPANWIIPKNGDVTFTLHDPWTLDQLAADQELGGYGRIVVDALWVALGRVAKEQNARVGIAYEIDGLVNGNGYGGRDKKEVVEMIRENMERARRLSGGRVEFFPSGSATEWAQPANFGPGRNHLRMALDTDLFDRGRVYLDIEAWLDPRYPRDPKFIAKQWLWFHEEEVLKRVIPEHEGTSWVKVKEGAYERAKVYTYVTPAFLKVLREIEQERGRPIDPRIEFVLMDYHYPEGHEVEALRESLEQADLNVHAPVGPAINLSPTFARTVRQMEKGTGQRFPIQPDGHLADWSASRLQRLIADSAAKKVVVNVREALALMDLLKTGRLSIPQQKPVTQVAGAAAATLTDLVRSSLGLPTQREVWQQQPRPEEKSRSEEYWRFVRSWAAGLLWGMIGTAPLFHLPDDLLRWVQGEFGIHPDSGPLGPEAGTLLKLMAQALGIISNGRIKVEKVDLVLYPVDAQGKRIEGRELEIQDILGRSSPIILPAGVRHAGELRMTLRRIRIPKEQMEKLVRQQLERQLGREPTAQEVKEALGESGWDGALSVAMATKVSKAYMASGDNPPEEWGRVRFSPGEETRVATLPISPMDPGPNWIILRTFDVNGEVVDLLGPARDLHLTSRYAPFLARAHLSRLQAHAGELEQQILQMNPLALLTGGRGDLIARVPFAEVQKAVQKRDARERLMADFQVLRTSGVTAFSVQVEDLEPLVFEYLLNMDTTLSQPEPQEIRGLRDLASLSHRFGMRIGLEIDQESLRALKQKQEAKQLEKRSRDRNKRRDTTLDILRRIMEGNEKGDWGLDFMALHQGGEAEDALMRERIEGFFQSKEMALVVMGPPGNQAVSNQRSQYAAIVENSLNEIEQHLNTTQLDKPLHERYAHAVAVAGEKGSFRSLIKVLKALPQLKQDIGQERGRLRLLYEERLRTPAKSTLEKLGLRDPQAIRQVQEYARTVKQGKLDQDWEAKNPLAMIMVEALAAEVNDAANVSMADRYGTIFDQARLLANGLHLTPLIQTGSSRPEMRPLVAAHLYQKEGEPIRLGVQVKNYGNVVGDYDVHLFLSHPAWNGALHHVEPLRLQPGEEATVWIEIRDLPATPDDAEYRFAVLPRGTEFLRPGMPASMTNQERVLARVNGMVHNLDAIESNLRSDLKKELNHEPTGVEWEKEWKKKIEALNHNDIEEEFQNFLNRVKQGIQMGYPGPPEAPEQAGLEEKITLQKVLAVQLGREPTQEELGKQRAAFQGALRLQLEREPTKEDLLKEERRMVWWLHQAHSYFGPYLKVGFVPPAQIKKAEDGAALDIGLVSNQEELRRGQFIDARDTLQAEQSSSVTLLDQIPPQKQKPEILRLLEVSRWGVRAALLSVGALLLKGWVARRQEVGRNQKAGQIQRQQEQRLREAQVVPQSTEATPVAYDRATAQRIWLGGIGFTAHVDRAVTDPEQGKPTRARLLHRGHAVVGVTDSNTQRLSQNIERRPLTLVQRFRRNVLGAIFVTVAVAVALPLWLIGTTGVAVGVAVGSAFLVYLAWKGIAASLPVQQVLGWLLERPGAILHNAWVNEIFAYAGGPLLLLGVLKVLGLLGLSSVTTISLPLIGAIGIPTALVLGLAAGLAVLGLWFSRAWEYGNLTVLTRALGSLGLAILGIASIVALAPLGLSASMVFPVALGIIAIAIVTTYLMSWFEGPALALAGLIEPIWSVGRFLVKWTAIVGAVVLVFKAVGPATFGLWAKVAGVSLVAGTTPVMIGLLAVVALLLYFRFELGRPQIEQLLSSVPAQHMARGVVALGGGWAIFKLLPWAMGVLGLPMTVAGALVGIGVLTTSLYLVNKALTALERPSVGSLVRLTIAVAIGALGIGGIFWLAALGVSGWFLALAVGAAIEFIPMSMMLVLRVGQSEGFGQRAAALWQLLLIGGPVGFTWFIFKAAAALGLSGPAGVALGLTYVAFFIFPALLSWSAINAFLIQPARFWVQRQFEMEEDREQTLRQAVSYLHAWAGMQGVASPVTRPLSDLPAGELETTLNQLTTALNLSQGGQQEVLHLFSRRRRTPAEQAELYELYQPALFQQAWVEARTNAEHHRMNPNAFPTPGQRLLTEEELRLVNWHYWKLRATQQATEYLLTERGVPAAAAQAQVREIPPQELTQAFFHEARDFSEEDQLALHDAYFQEHLKAHADIILSQDAGTLAREFWNGFWTGSLSQMLWRFRNDDRLEVVMPALILSFGFDTEGNESLARRLERGDSIAWWTLPIQLARVGLMSYAVPLGFLASMANRKIQSTLQPGNTANPMVDSADAGVQGYLGPIEYVKKVMGRWLESHKAIMRRAYLGKKVVRSAEEHLAPYRSVKKHGTLHQHIDRLVEQALQTNDTAERHQLLKAAFFASLRGSKNVFFDHGLAEVPLRFYRAGWRPDIDGSSWGKKFNEGMDVVAQRFDRPGLTGVTVYFPTASEIVRDQEGKKQIRLTNHPERFVIEMPQSREPKDRLANAALSYWQGYLTPVPRGISAGLEERPTPKRRIEIGFESEEGRAFPELERARREIEDPNNRFLGIRRKWGEGAAKTILGRVDARRRRERGLDDVTAVSRWEGGFDGYKDLKGMRFQFFKAIARWLREKFLGYRIQDGRVTRGVLRTLPYWGVTLAAGGAVYWFTGIPILFILVAFGLPFLGALFGDLAAKSFIGFMRDPMLQGIKAHYDPRMLEQSMEEFFDRIQMQPLESALGGQVTIDRYKQLIDEGWKLVKPDPELREWVMDYPHLIHPEHPIYKWFMEHRRSRLDLRARILARVTQLINTQTQDPARRAHLWRAFREAVTHNTEGELMGTGDPLTGILYNRSHARGVDRGGTVESQFSVDGQGILEAVAEVMGIPVGSDRSWLRRNIGAHFGAARLPSLPGSLGQEVRRKLERWVELRNQKAFLDAAESDAVGEAREQLLSGLKAKNKALGEEMKAIIDWVREDIRTRSAPIEMYLREGGDRTVSAYFSEETFLQPDLENVNDFLIEESRLLAEHLPESLTRGLEQHDRYLSAREDHEGKPREHFLRANQAGWSPEKLNRELRWLKEHLRRYGVVRLTQNGWRFRQIRQWFEGHPVAADLFDFVSTPAAIGAGAAALLGAPVALTVSLALVGAPALLYRVAQVGQWLLRKVRPERYSREAVILSILYGVTENQVIRRYNSLGGAVVDLKESALDGLFDSSQWTRRIGTYAYPGTSIARVPIARGAGNKAKAEPVPFVAAVLLLEEPPEFAADSGNNTLPTDADEIQEATGEDTLFAYVNDDTPWGRPTINASSNQKKEAREGKQELRKADEAPVRAAQIFKGMSVTESARRMWNHPIFDHFRDSDDAKTLQRLFGWDPDVNNLSNQSIFGLEAFRRDEHSWGGRGAGAGTLDYGYFGFSFSPLDAVRLGPFASGYVPAYWTYHTYRLVDQHPENQGAFFREIRRFQQRLQPQKHLSDETTRQALLQGPEIDPFDALAEMGASQPNRVAFLRSPTPAMKLLGPTGYPLVGSGFVPKADLLVDSSGQPLLRPKTIPTSLPQLLDSAGQPLRSGPADSATGLEEVSTRRDFLKGAGAALLASSLPNLLPQPAQAQVPQEPQGALKPLVDRLGKEAEVGFITWKPIDFKKAVRAGFTTVWISGRDFLERSPQEQQAILDRASAAGLRTLGFIDGDPLFSRREKLNDVRRLYSQLTGALLNRRFGPVFKIAFAADIEPHGDPTWQGDLSAYSDAIDAITSAIQTFAKQASQRFGREVALDRLTRIEAFYYQNGHVDGNGRRIQGLRETEHTTLGSMTYRASAAETVAISGVARARVRKAQDVKLLIGVETKAPDREIPAHTTFHGKWGEIGNEMIEVVDAFEAAGDKKLLGGLFIHTNWEQAEKVLDALLAKSSATPSKAASKGAAATKEVELVKESIKRTDTQLSGQLKGAPAGARVVGLLKVKGDNYYWQPRDGNSVPVGADGKFSLETVYNGTTRPGWLKAQEAVILVFGSSADVTAFLATYPKEVGLRRVPERKEIKPEPVRVIRIPPSGEPDVSWQFFRPILYPAEAELQIGWQILPPVEVAAGLEEARTVIPSFWRARGIGKQVERILQDSRLGEIPSVTAGRMRYFLNEIVEDINHYGYQRERGFRTTLTARPLTHPDRIVVEIQDQVARYQRTQGIAPKDFRFSQMPLPPEDVKDWNSIVEEHVRINGREGGIGSRSISNAIAQGWFTLEESWDPEFGNRYVLTFPIQPPVSNPPVATGLEGAPPVTLSSSKGDLDRASISSARTVALIREETAIDERIGYVFRPMAAGLAVLFSQFKDPDRDPAVFYALVRTPEQARALINQGVDPIRIVAWGLDPGIKSYAALGIPGDNVLAEVASEKGAIEWAQGMLEIVYGLKPVFPPDGLSNDAQVLLAQISEWLDAQGWQADRPFTEPEAQAILEINGMA